MTAAIIPAKGQVIVVTPFFESPSIHEMLQVPAEIRPWQEDENPFELIAKSVAGMGEGPLAVDSNVRFFVTDAREQGCRRPSGHGSGRRVGTRLPNGQVARRVGIHADSQ